MKAQIIIILLTIINVCSVYAADPAVTGIKISELKILREKENLALSFSAYISERTVRSDNRWTVTPQLYNDNGAVSMEPFTITGRQMDRREKQKNLINKKSSAATDSDIPQKKYANTTNGSTMLYTYTISYEPWMVGELRLHLLVTESGCCSITDLGAIQVEAPISLPPLPTPFLSGVQTRSPEVVQMVEQYPFLRLIGKDIESGDAPHVRFRVSNSKLDLAFSSNAENVGTITKAVEMVLKGSQTDLEKISISGFASPEGTRVGNLELSKNRAKALSRYLMQQLNLPESIFELQFDGEDWEGLLELVRQSDMRHKESIIDIITNSPKERRNDILKHLEGGRPYQSLYDIFYPQLRDACYINVWYSEKRDEAADAINLAVDRIKNTRYDEALQILSTVENDPRAWNAIGACHLLRGDYPKARAWFIKAADGGDKDAERNLELINK